LKCISEKVFFKRIGDKAQAKNLIVTFLKPLFLYAGGEYNASEAKLPRTPKQSEGVSETKFR